MEISSSDKAASIKSMQSTIGKLEKALEQMAQKGSNTALVEKRLKALAIGLAVLQYVWHQNPHPYTHEDLAEARRVLLDLLPSIESSYAKAKPGSSQRTLLERRLKALELAIQALAGHSESAE